MDISIYLGCFFFLVLLPLTLCLLSRKARFYMKYYFYFLNIGLISIVVMFLSLLPPRNADNIRYYYFPMRILSCILGIQFEVRGAHHIPKHKPCVIVINHQTILEPLGAAFTFKDVLNLATLARKENLVYYVPLGWATWLCGCIFIDRYNHKSAMKTMETCTKTLLTKQVKLVIFPEGTTATKPDSFLPFKNGAFNLAVKAQIPVAPVVISTFNHFFNEEETKFETGKVIITCLPPVSTDGLTSEDVNDLTEDIRCDMLETFKRTNDEVLPE